MLSAFSKYSGTRRVHYWVQDEFRETHMRAFCNPRVSELKEFLVTVVATPETLCKHCDRMVKKSEQATGKTADKKDTRLFRTRPKRHDSLKPR